jgi:hypothetical protein
LVDDGALVFKAGTSLKTCPPKEIKVTKFLSFKPYPKDDDPLTIDIATGKMSGNSVGFTGENTLINVITTDINDKKITFPGYIFKNKCVGAISVKNDNADPIEILARKELTPT